MPWNNPFSQSNSSPPPSPGGESESDWVNPFQNSQPSGPADPKKPPEPTLEQLTMDPAELRKNWDYKSATTGMFGESLPEGADRWTPYGTPYFGGGITGKLKEYRWMFTRDSSGPTSQEWDDLWKRWGTALKDVGAANASKNTSRNEAMAEARATGADSAIAGLLLLLAIWEAGTQAGVISRWALPTLSSVVLAWIGLLQGGELVYHAAASLMRGGVGLGLAIVVGTTLGVLMGSALLLQALFTTNFCDCAPPPPAPAGTVAAAAGTALWMASGIRDVPTWVSSVARILGLGVLAVATAGLVRALADAASVDTA